MQFAPTKIVDVVLVTPKKIGDQRGYFSETFRSDLFAQNIGTFNFVQDNQSHSADAGTIRGLHFQLEPRAQGKLIRCIAGSVLDVAVDIRKGSPTFGQYVEAELTAENGCQLWIPAGFAHGFCTLQPNTIITYKVTNYYNSDHDRGILWNDPKLDIRWPVTAEKAVLSAKDRAQPLLAELEPTSFTTATGS